MQFVSAYIETPATPREAVVAFSNGVMNQAVFKVSDITPYINFTWLGNTDNPNQWSQYFLTDNVIWYHQVFAQVWYLDSVNKQFTKYGGQIGGTGSRMCIPTKRLYGYSKIIFTARMPQDSSGYYYVGGYCGAIVDGLWRESNRTGTHSGSWTELELDISDLPYIDYIVLDGCDGYAYIKEIKLE